MTWSSRCARRSRTTCRGCCRNSRRCATILRSAKLRIASDDHAGTLAGRASSSCACKLVVHGRRNGVERSELRERLRSSCRSARAHALRLIEQLRQIADAMRTAGAEMDFRFLLRSPAQAAVHRLRRRNRQSARRLLRPAGVGGAHRRLPRRGQGRHSAGELVPAGAAPTSWTAASPVLISWTGTMFEYLMPIALDALVSRDPAGAQHGSRGAARNRSTPRQRIPWGISECAFAKLDEQGVYGYRAFGVPQLGAAAGRGAAGGGALCHHAGARRRSRSGDQEPALDDEEGMVRHATVITKRPISAADVRPSRRQRFALVRSWMAHHQGMSLLAIANFLQDGVVQQLVPPRCSRAGHRTSAAGTSRRSRRRQQTKEAANPAGEPQTARGVAGCDKNTGWSELLAG